MLHFSVNNFFVGSWASFCGVLGLIELYVSGCSVQIRVSRW